MPPRPWLSQPAIACNAAARAEATPKCGAMFLYGSICSDGNGLTAPSRAAADAPSSAAMKNLMSMQNRSTSSSPGRRPRVTALFRWLDWTATNSACADEDSPRTCVADESIPVRAAAVLRRAWRLSEVVVGIRRVQLKPATTDAVVSALRRTVSCQLSQTLNTLPRAGCGPLGRRAPRRFRGR